MKYLHTMVRISDIDASLDFYCNKLGLVELKRKDSEKGLSVSSELRRWWEHDQVFPHPSVCLS